MGNVLTEKYKYTVLNGAELPTYKAGSANRGCFQMNSIASTIWPLWLQLGRARAEALEFDVQPWKSSSPAVLDAWERLINPINLVALEALQKESHEMNPAAKMGASKALELCRELSREKSETLKTG